MRRPFRNTCLALPLTVVALLPAAVASAQSTPQARSEQAQPPVFEDVQGSADTLPVAPPESADGREPPTTLPDLGLGDANPPSLRASAANATLARDSMLRAQILLERARFSSGEIDGEAGSNTRRAIAAFQEANDLEASGELDEQTWMRLERDTAPLLVDYTITAADVAGPYTAIPDDMMAKSKLASLGYASLEEALGERFHASPALLASLNPDTRFAEGATIAVPNVSGLPQLAKAEQVVVDKSDASVRLVDAEGRTYARFPASSGSAHDPLPIGQWKINGVGRNPEFRYNPKLFWDADPGHSKAVLPPGPNNPVGVAWIDLSKDHYGIHGTPEPSKIGKTQSHGCIRMTNWSVKAVSDAIAPGTPAVLQP